MFRRIYSWLLLQKAMRLADAFYAAANEVVTQTEAFLASVKDPKQLPVDIIQRTSTYSGKASNLYADILKMRIQLLSAAQTISAIVTRIIANNPSSNVRAEANVLVISINRVNTYVCKVVENFENSRENANRLLYSQLCKNPSTSCTDSNMSIEMWESFLLVSNIQHSVNLLKEPIASLSAFLKDGQCDDY